MSSPEHADSSKGVHVSQSLRLPLNSKHVTATQIKRVSRALGLPTSASTEEVRQMIEGKLEDQSRQLSDVQVVVQPPGKISLHDEGGEFLAIPPEDIVLPPERAPTDEASGDRLTEIETLCTSLQQAKEEIATLKTEIASLKMQLCHSKAEQRGMAEQLRMSGETG